MKTSFICLVTALLCSNLLAQTADQLVNQGLSDLSVQDPSDANTNFAQALTVSSTNEDANALYAITRLLVLPNQPAGSNYVVLVFTNLLIWSPVSTSSIPASGSINLTNSAVRPNQRFYRTYLQ